MQPDGAAGGGGASGGDLLGRTFPVGDWGEPAERLDELYQWVEQGALLVVDRQLDERARKRRGARLLRAGTAAGVTTGATLPALNVADAVGDTAGAWGFVALLAAAACVAADRHFGLTAGWMRSVATAQAVQRRLQTLHYDWATESIREVLGPAEGTAGEAAERCLGVLRRFAEDVSEIVRVETADWMVELGVGTAPLRTQSAAMWAPREPGDCGGAGGGRYLLPPGARPNMPGQRRPEGPR